MEDIIRFLDIHYKNALKLVSDFDITKNKKWDPQIYLNELYVQLGHVYNVLFNNDEVNETKRKINNLGDELSDVLLQLINLSKILNIDMYEIQKLKDYSYDNINGISILLGQLTEAVMEINECRFKKSRYGFDSSYDFVKDRIFKLFIITYNISKDYKLDMIKEFGDMLNDANGFLDRFRKQRHKIDEYIDIYDSKENLLGYCEKEKAHKLGYWHRVFGCLIYNSKKNRVFLQLKNPDHNNRINKKPLLEITAGGHLISGETIMNGVREIKEETGFDVEYEKLIFLEKRKCNKVISKNYKIKEFQYYYSLDLNINVTDFKNFDRAEVLSFVEISINDLTKLLNNKVKNIKVKNSDNKDIIVCIDDLDPAYIKNGLYVELLSKLASKGSEKNMKRKIKKLNRIKNYQKRRRPEEFYFDDGKVCNFKDYSKEEIKYSVQLVNTNRNTNNYIVCLLAIVNHKPIPQLLKREFKGKKGTIKYFNEICNLIENNNNQDIINKCYNDTMKNINKSIVSFSHFFF